MHLYFVRHGLANWPEWSGNDSERPLTAEGSRRLQAAAAGLARRAPQVDLILHSPLTRARQTAEIIAAQLGLADRVRAHPLLEPGFNRNALQTLLHEYRDARALLLVGHAPDMNEVVTELTHKPVKFKEGTVAHVRLNKRNEGTLKWIASADELAEE